jgi:hypothetical protein
MFGRLRPTSIQKNQPFSVGFFSSAFPGVGAVLGLRLLSIQDPKSWIHAGFEAAGLRRWLLGSARPICKYYKGLRQKSTALAHPQQVLVQIATE